MGQLFFAAVLMALSTFLPMQAAQVSKVVLVHDFTARPSSQDLFENSEFFFQLRSQLALRNIQLYSSDLTEYGFVKKTENFTKLLFSPQYFIKNKKALKQLEENTVLVFWNRPPYVSSSLLKRLPYEKMILFTWEPPAVQKALYSKKTMKSFSKVFTWDDSLVDNKKFFKFFFPVMHPMMEEIPAYEKKKLCTMIAGNKASTYPNELYSQRRAVIDYFEKCPGSDFEFYGNGWPAEYKNYQGSCINKWETLKNYKFSICYENMTGLYGYITEKIFDCFTAGCVPVYWGAVNITDYIPKNCFVDRRDFKTHEELHSFLKGMDEKTYNAYLENIRAFLGSPNARQFSPEAFIERFYEALLPNLERKG